MTGLLGPNPEPNTGPHGPTRTHIRAKKKLGNNSKNTFVTIRAGSAILAHVCDKPKKDTKLNPVPKSSPTWRSIPSGASIATEWAQLGPKLRHVQ